MKKLVFTKAQLEALKEMIDTYDSAFEEYPICQKQVKLLDKMLLKNGIRRHFKMTTDKQ